MARAGLPGKGTSEQRLKGRATVSLAIDLAGPQRSREQLGFSNTIFMAWWVSFVLGSPVPEFLATHIHHECTQLAHTKRFHVSSLAARVDTLAGAKAATLEPLLGPQEVRAVTLVLPCSRKPHCPPTKPNEVGGQH